MLVTGFSDLKIKTPQCSPGVLVLTADFRLDNDITEIFPYINAVVEGAQYYENPIFIRFEWNGKMCTLNSDNGYAVPFETHAEVETYVNSLIEFINDLYAKKDIIKPDNEKYKPVPVIDIYKILPGNNCGDCGFKACMAFAAALSKGDVQYNRCPDLLHPEKENDLVNLKLM